MYQSQMLVEKNIIQIALMVMHAIEGNQGWLWNPDNDHIDDEACYKRGQWLENSARNNYDV